MWGVQLLLVNAYVLYKTAHLYLWKKNKRSIMGQHEFQPQLALAWLLSESDPGSQVIKCTRTISTDDSECASSYSKARKVSNASLDPNSGTLCI
jgi:hypothetical protein